MRYQLLLDCGKVVPKPCTKFHGHRQMNVYYGSPPSSSRIAALQEENPSKKQSWLTVPCLLLESVANSQNYYNAFSTFCIKWSKALNIAMVFLHTEGSECRNAAFLWHSLEISVVSQESTPSFLNTLHLPQNNSPPFHQGNLDQAPSFNYSISPCLFLNASGGGRGERRRLTHGLSSSFHSR